MTRRKRKVSISLDEDLVAELESDGDGLSSQINDLLRDEIEHRRRLRQLGLFLDALEEEEGPPDPALVEKFRKLFQS